MEGTKEEKISGEQYPVRRVCPVCTKDMGLADYTSSTPGEISHGYCPECLKKIMEEIDNTKENKQ